jgi:hypothetical protein
MKTLKYDEGFSGELLVGHQFSPSLHLTVADGGCPVVDKIQSLYQGRPVTLKESDVLVPIKFLDTYEEFEHWTPFAYTTQSTTYSGSPAYSVSTFASLCRLSVVMSDILGEIYRERIFNESPNTLSALLERLDLKLATWRKDLPRHLSFDPKKSTQLPPPHVFSLQCVLLSRLS